MVYLKAWHFIIRKNMSIKNKVIILDHGPIFRLAFLDEFGPKFTRNLYYKKWWSNVSEVWQTTLDAIVWLDAPDDILFKRIQSRKRWHEIKEEPKEVAYSYLNRYRKSCEKIISGMSNDLKLLEFDTMKNNPDQITDKVMNFIDLMKKENNN